MPHTEITVQHVEHPGPQISPLKQPASPIIKLSSFFFLLLLSPRYVLMCYQDNKIICWKPGGDPHITTNEKRSAYLGDPVTTLHKHEYAGCEIWYVRFSLDSSCSILAVGNQEGKVFVWDLDSKNPSSKSSRQTLETKYCNSAVRQTSISHGGSIIISVCDDGSVWRWDRR